MIKHRIIFLTIAAILTAGVLVYNSYPGDKIPRGIVIDSIVVIKSERQMNVFAKRQLVKTYTVALGKTPIGAKQYEGDNKTPEGVYYINTKNPESKYHKNLGVSYPNDTDVANAAKMKKPVGGDIKIHGLQNGLGFIGRIHTLSDWTAGCIALTNEEIDDLYAHTPIGAAIEIRP